MIQTGYFDLDKIENFCSDGRKKYPWHVLKKRGDYFIWDKKEDANRIRAAAKFIKFNISTRTISGKLHVIRIN